NQRAAGLECGDCRDSNGTVVGSDGRNRNSVRQGMRAPLIAGIRRDYDRPGPALPGVAVAGRPADGRASSTGLDRIFDSRTDGMDDLAICGWSSDSELP